VWAGVSDDLAAGTITDEECRLEPGDTVLLHTDGVTEATNATREMFGIDRLCRALERVADSDVDAIRDSLLAEVRGFMSAQADDLTLVVLRYV
jgi:sigma-B regulation protein RsbU (phosphoserine phosphatase)